MWVVCRVLNKRVCVDCYKDFVKELSDHDPTLIRLVKK